MATNDVSIPIKLLMESISQIVTVETKTGDSYRGELIFAQENMSFQLKNVVATFKNGQKKSLEQAYLRGSQVKYFILPDILESSPIFKKVRSAKRKFDKTQKESTQASKKRKILKTT